MKLGLVNDRDSKTASTKNPLKRPTTSIAADARLDVNNQNVHQHNHVCIGDHIKFVDTVESNVAGDVLCGDGIVVNDLFSLRSPNLLYESFEFVIVPQRHYTRVSSGDDLEFAKREEEQNNSILETNVGCIVRFGDIIQLQHVISKKFVTVSLQHEPANDSSDCLKVSLRSGGNQGSWFEILPRYKHDCLGHPIANGSQLSLRSVLTNHFLSIPNSRDSRCIDIPREVSASVSKQSWKVLVSRRPYAAKDSRVFNGQLVSIVDSENGSRVRVSSAAYNKDADLDLSPGDKYLCLKTKAESTTMDMDKKLQSRTSEISNLWIIERDWTTAMTMAEEGLLTEDWELKSSTDEIMWFTDKVFLRDITTGLFLALKVDDTGPAAGSGSGSGPQGPAAMFYATKAATAEKCSLKVAPMITSQKKPYLQPNRAVSIKGSTSDKALSPAAINKNFSSDSKMAASTRSLSAADVEDQSESYSESFWFDVYHRSEAEALCGLRAAAYLRAFYALLFTTDAAAVSHELRNFEHVLRTLQRNVRDKPYARLDKVKFNEPVVGEFLLTSLQTSFREQGVIDALLDILELTSAPAEGGNSSPSAGSMQLTFGAFCGLDKLKVNERKLPIEVVRALNALKESAELGTSFAVTAADRAAEENHSYPGIVYFPLRRGTASCRGYLSPDAVVGRISRACLRLLLDTIFNHESNKAYVAKRIGIILSHLRRQPLAVSCFVEMTRESDCVTDWHISNEVITFLLDMLADDTASHEEALRLLRSICASGGDAFRTNRWLVFTALMKDNKLHDSIYEIKPDDGSAAVIKLDYDRDTQTSMRKGLVRRVTDLFIDTSSDKHGRQLSDANRRIRYFRKSFIVDATAALSDRREGRDAGEEGILGLDLLNSGIPDIVITYNVSMSAAAMFGDDGGSTAAATPAANVLQKFSTTLSSLDSQSSYGTSTKINIAAHLDVQLQLMAALSMGRNQSVISSLRTAYTYDSLIAIIMHPNVPPSVKAAACCCLRRMYIDVDPQVEIEFPRLARTVHSLSEDVPEKRTFSVVKKVFYECLPSCMDKDSIECGLSSELVDVIYDLLRFGDFANREQIHCLADGIIEVLDKELHVHADDLDSSIHMGHSLTANATVTATPAGNDVAEVAGMDAEPESQKIEKTRSLFRSKGDDQMSTVSSSYFAERLYRRIGLNRDSPYVFYLKASFFMGDSIATAQGSVDGLTIEGYILGFLNSLLVLVTVVVLAIASVIVAAIQVRQQGDMASMDAFSDFVACFFACELGLRTFCHIQVYGELENLIVKPYYWVDVVVVVLSIMELLASHGNGILYILRILRILRIVRFVTAAKTMARIETARLAKTRRWLPPSKWSTESRLKTSLMAKLIHCLKLIQKRAEDKDMTILMNAYMQWRADAGRVSPLAAYTASLNQSKRITFPGSLPQTLLHAVMYDDDALSASALRLLHALYAEQSQLLVDAARAQVITEPRIVSVFEASSRLIRDIQRNLVLYVESTNTLPDETSTSAQQTMDQSTASANHLIASLKELQRLCQAQPDPSPRNENCNEWPSRDAQDVMRCAGISTILSQFHRLQSFSRSRANGVDFYRTFSFSSSSNLVDMMTSRDSRVDALEEKLVFAFNSFFTWFSLDNHENQRLLFDHLDLWLEDKEGIRGSASVISAIFKNNFELCRLLTVENVDSLCEGLINGDHRCSRLEALVGISSQKAASFSTQGTNHSQNAFNVTAVALDRLEKWIHLTNFRSVVFYWCDPIDSVGYLQRLAGYKRRETLAAANPSWSAIENDVVRDYTRLDSVEEEKLLCHIFSLQLLANVDLGGLQLFAIYPHQHIVAAILDMRTDSAFRSDLMHLLAAGLRSRKAQVRWIHASEGMMNLLEAIRDALVDASQQGDDGAEVENDGSNTRPFVTFSQGRKYYTETFLMNSAAIVAGFFHDFGTLFPDIRSGLKEDRSVFADADFPITERPVHTIQELLDSLFLVVSQLFRKTLPKSVSAALRHARDTLKVVASEVVTLSAESVPPTTEALGAGILRKAKNPFKTVGVASRIRRVSEVAEEGDFCDEKPSGGKNAKIRDGNLSAAEQFTRAVEILSPEESQSTTDEYFRVDFLRGLSKLNQCPAETMAKVLVGLPRQDAAIDKGSIRLEGFVKKMCEFVSNSIKSDDTGFKIVEYSSVDPVLWVLKSLRLALQLTWDPSTNQGMSFDVRFKLGGAIPSDAAVAELQEIYRIGGCCAICVDLINTGVDDVIVYEAVRLLVCMLLKDGGHRTTQEELMKLLNDADSSHFFLKLQSMIVVVTVWCFDISHDVNTTEDYFRPKSRPPEMAALQLVRLICEGDYQQSKDLIRVQSRNNVAAVNLVGTLANFIDELSRLNRLTDYDTMLTVFSTIRQLLQGPCVGNQDFLINQTDFVNALNRLVILHSVSATGKGGSKGYDAKTVEIVGKINRLLLCCLEGQLTGSVVHSRIVNAVNFSIFQKVILPPNMLEEVERSGLTEAQRSFLTLVRVFVGHDDYAGARKLGISSKIVELVKSDVAGLEVFFQGRLKKYFFTFPHFYRAHLKKQFSMLLDNIERSSQEHKMQEFMRASKNIYIDLHHQNWLKRLGIYQLVSTRNRTRMTTIKFISAVILNVLMLVYYEVNEETHEPDLFHHTDIIDGLLILHLILCLAVLSIHLIGRTPVHFQRALHANPTKGSVAALRKALLNPKLVYHSIQLILVVVSIAVSKMAISFFMLDIIRVSATARDVLKAISRPARQLFVTMFLAVIALNIFASYAFFRYRHVFHHGEIDETACESWWSCLRVFMTYGLRLESGIGYYMMFDNGLRAFTLDVPVFIIVNVILLDITFGVIVETFAELRSEKDERQKEMRGKCFICGIPATIFDNNMLVGGLSKGFNRHFAAEHYAINYLAFMVKILDQDQHLDDGVERYVRNCMSRNDVSWLPIHKALCITGPGSATVQSTGEEEGQEGEGEEFEKYSVDRLSKPHSAAVSSSTVAPTASSRTRRASVMLGDGASHLSQAQVDLASANFSIVQAIHRQQQTILARLDDFESMLTGRDMNEVRSRPAATPRSARR